MIYERLIKNIEDNYQNHLKGGFNFIPIGFDRFSKFVPGIVKSSYTIVTASSGVGKSKLVRALYVVNVLDFIKEHPEIKVIIPIFSLELSAEEYLADILCSFLYRDYGIEISYRELLSIHAKGEEVRINQDIIDKLKKYDDWIKFFYKSVRIYSDIHNPYGIFKKVKEIINQSVKGKESVKLDDEGYEMKFWDYDDNNIFVIPILDQINLLATEKNLPDLRSAMIKFSADYALTLKNYYQCHLVVIQQQSSDKERVEHDMSGKAINSKLEPSLDGLGDCKTTQREATEVIGLFAPDRYEINEHSGYNITIFKDTYRSVKLLKSRYTSPNKKIGMLFRGGIGTFEELPRPEEFQSDRDYIKYLTEKGVIKEEKKEPVKKGPIKLGTFKTDN